MEIKVTTCDGNKRLCLFLVTSLILFRYLKVLSFFLSSVAWYKLSLYCQTFTINEYLLANSNEDICLENIEAVKWTTSRDSS